MHARPSFSAFCHAAVYVAFGYLVEGSLLNTPAHLIVGVAAFGRPGSVAVNAGAVAGSLLPDLSLYAMAVYALYIQNIPASTVFGELYFSSEWQSVFVVDNSIFLWLLVLGIGRISRTAWSIAAGAAGVIHIATDFLLHHDDGRPHFWPFSKWIFESPISYWDSNHYGGIVGPLEGIMCLLLCILLWRRFRTWLARGLIAAIGLAEVMPTVVFGFLF